MLSIEWYLALPSKVAGSCCFSVGEELSCEPLSEHDLDGSKETIDQLRLKLSKLETEATKRAQTPEQREAVKQIAAAKTEAEKGNRAGVVAKLKSAGMWVGGIAKELGSSVIAK